MTQGARRTPYSSRIAGWIALTVLLLIPLLGVSATSASAQQGTCDGEVIDGSCVIDLGPPACVAPATFDGAESCVTSVDPESVPSCPDGARGEPGACYILVAKGPAGPSVCENGELIGNSCVITGAPPTQECPDGYETDEALAGLCARFEPASENPPACPDGARGEPGACYILVAKGPAGPSEPPACPSGSTEDGNGDCRKPVPDAAPTYFCTSPLAALNGTSCVFTTGYFLQCAPDFGLVGGQCIQYEKPITNPANCPTGSIEDGNGDCRKPVPDHIELVCPEGTTLGEGVCGATAPAICAAGQLTNGSCLESTPLAFCNGQVVTINMRLGDSGTGTTGNDVILGTSGADTINARGGDDVICASGGDDIVRGGAGNDFILGQSGNDDIRGGSGDDVLRGGSGNDDIRGGSGDDDIRGGRDTDVLRGGGGDDVLRGGAGANDNCIGNAGTDTATSSCEITSSIP